MQLNGVVRYANELSLTFNKAVDFHSISSSGEDALIASQALTHWLLWDVVLSLIVIFKLISRKDLLSTSYEIALRWLPQNLAED